MHFHKKLKLYIRYAEPNELSVSCWSVFAGEITKLAHIFTPKKHEQIHARALESVSIDFRMIIMDHGQHFSEMATEMRHLQ